MGSTAAKKELSMQDIPIYTPKEMGAMAGMLMQKAQKAGLKGMNVDEQVQLRLLATWYYG